MALLSIPKRQYAVLRKIAELSLPQFEQLLAGLNEIEASLNSEQFSKRLSEKIKTIQVADVGSFVDLLCGLYPAKESRNKTAAQIAHDVRETTEEDKPSNFPLDKIDLLEDRMTKLLNIDKAIAVTAKAYDVVTEHQNLLSGVRIFSDIRPVFSASADSVSAAVVVHTVNITYHQGMDHKELYVAMDRSDIDLFKKAIERAEKKSKALQSIIEKAGITYLEAGE